MFIKCITDDRTYKMNEDKAGTKFNGKKSLEQALRASNRSKKAFCPVLKWQNIRTTVEPSIYKKIYSLASSKHL